MECFTCKQTGHIANSCPNPPNNSLDLDISPEGTKETTQESTGLDHTTTQPEEPSLTQAPCQKRLHSDTLSTSDQLRALEENSPISHSVKTQCHLRLFLRFKLLRKLRKRNEKQGNLLDKAYRKTINKELPKHIKKLHTFSFFL
ncbi:hypothetical protein HHI36_023814 [Cryptolaemus montrouzieri]|uniref:CCHC-type domain-containing protein n=1 Tax=Cryptolaemus montrouzieri TaxID=559131 RepID=A0ABD2PHK9_9CUCU